MKIETMDYLSERIKDINLLKKMVISLDEKSPEELEVLVDALDSWTRQENAVSSSFRWRYSSIKNFNRTIRVASSIKRKRL